MPRVMFLTLLLLSNGVARLFAPEEVPVVKTDRAVISAPHFPAGYRVQNGGFVEARDLGTNKLLWRVQVYQTVYDNELETDMQDVFIKSLSLHQNQKLLILTDEIERVFVLNLESKVVTRVV